MSEPRRKLSISVPKLPESMEKDPAVPWLEKPNRMQDPLKPYNADAYEQERKKVLLREALRQAEQEEKRK